MKMHSTLLSLSFGLLVGCATSLMSQAPVTRTVALTGTPQETYTQVARAYNTMGGQVQMADARARVISGIVHNAVQLNVHVDDDSRVHVTGHLVPGKLVVGSMTEVDDYIVLLTKEGKR